MVVVYFVTMSVEAATATTKTENASLDYFRGLDERQKYAHVVSQLQLLEVMGWHSSTGCIYMYMCGDS